MSLRWPGFTAFFYHVLKHLLIQTQIRDQLLELFVLLFELTQAPQLVRAHAGVFLLPVEERRLGDSHLAADLVDPGTSFRLLTGAKPIWASVNFDFFHCVRF